MQPKEGNRSMDAWVFYYPVLASTGCGVYNNSGMFGRENVTVTEIKKSFVPRDLY